jgi:hypothetical protein
MVRAGGPFGPLHAALVADAAIPWGALDAASIPAALRDAVRDTWAWRAQTEYRSAQVMTRFLGEILAAGDPLEVQAFALDCIRDEVRHTALCARVVEALGAAAALPAPLPEALEPDFLAMPMAARALVTAIAMLLVNETVSLALLRDLAARATHPTIRAVLAATTAEEETHADAGWHYVAASLARFDAAGRAFAAEVAARAVEGHQSPARALIASLPPEGRHLAAHDEPELARYGLMGEAREALLTLHTVETVLAPRLAQLGLLSP